MILSHEYTLVLGGSSLLIRIDRPELIKHRWEGMSHNHADFELHLLLSGRGRIDIEGESYSLQAGQAVLVAPGKYHCPTATKGEFERFSLCFSVKSGPLAAALAEAVDPCRVFDATEEIMDFCRKIFSEFSENRLFGAELLRCHLLQLMVCNFRLLGLPLPTASMPGRSPILGRADYNDMVDLYFEEHLKEGASSEDLAARLFMSQRHMSRLLKESYGMTFREKLLRTRMDRAAWLLRHTDMTVTAVAAEVGYTVSSSFYHAFRQYYGMTPESYRAQNPKQNS